MSRRKKTLLNTTRTQAILLTQQRKQLEDAIAVFVGKPAPDFHLPPKELDAEPPSINAGLPSDLLERRPDIAEAEREMAIANAQVGIARAAYFPSLNLYANGGWQSADIAKLMNVQSTLWAIGANAPKPSSPAASAVLKFNSQKPAMTPASRAIVKLSSTLSAKCRTTSRVFSS